MSNFDIAVVGGGHAGIEAAIVSARLGFRTALITLEKDKIGMMSCNPAIGGLAKSQLVREIDALGGVMGKIADEAGIHFKMLNTSKGPAVQSLRVQADRGYYAKVAQNFIDATERLTVIEDMGVGLKVEGNVVTGVQLQKRGLLQARCVIITAGTFLNGIIHIGFKKISAGRAGEMPAVGMTESLQALGFISGRLKTGTPPRVHRDSIDYDQVEVQAPDPEPIPFSFSNESIQREQINCYIGYTNEKTHDILRTGFDRSPLFTGVIKGVGPRYCPSIEDKIKRFENKSRHQLFLEPEGYKNPEVYVNGFSTSLPAEVQEKAIRTVPALKNVKIIRLGYAVEYDFFPPNQIRHTLEAKGVDNLFFAGQINGTSGYEEAAAQGFMAGLNAVLKLKDQEPFVLNRSQAYIGVLIDDLINKTHDEPYRMFTSRAEFRLLLRQDNADLRLMNYGRKFGLIDDRTFKNFEKRREEIDYLYKRELSRSIQPKTFNAIYKNVSKPIQQAMPLKNVLKRPEVKLDRYLEIYGDRPYAKNSIDEVEFNIKYEGYINRQHALIEKFQRMEKKALPENIDYMSMAALSVEAREKLMKVQPHNLGQASRISGVTPADISALLVYLEKHKYMDVPRET